VKLQKKHECSHCVWNVGKYMQKLSIDIAIEMNVIDSNPKIYDFQMGSWIYFMNEKYRKLKFVKIKKDSTNTPDEFGITGKYLFYHTNLDVLEKIARDEIENNGFDVAKISTKPNYKDHVLCLYYKNDSRKDEFAKKYQGKNGIQYRYWKSDEDTKKGKYSKQFLDNL